MSVLDRAEAHFSDQLTSRLTIEVPEWGEVDNNGELKPATFIVKPENASQRRRYIQKVLNNDPEGMVELVIVRCLTTANVHAFRPTDKDRMMKKCDPNVINRIANQILDWDAERNDSVASMTDVEDKKND